MSCVIGAGDMMFGARTRECTPLPKTRLFWNSANCSRVAEMTANLMESDGVDARLIVLR